MDLDAVVDELYGLPPGSRLPAMSGPRPRRGDRELAEQICWLRRPTLRAWASNLLVCEQPDEVTQTPVPAPATYYGL
ncbi:hypothetical protein HEP87_63655 [Streptomyces sp. S1D4-11]